MTAAERKRLIAQRQQDSLFWWVIHRMGSLKLALTLLASISIACAIATFYESTFNAQVAQAYIYKAPWFILWLVVLCLNLAGAALTRWPWEKKHTGFLVTHAGIIILLIGAMIGMRSGYEAGVTLKTTDRPTNRLIMNETIIQFDSPKDGAIYITPLPVEVRGPEPDRPRVLDIPDSRLRLVVDKYHKSLVERPILIEAPAGGADRGVQLAFASNMMGQSIPVQLFAEGGEEVHHDFFGLAHLELLPALPEASLHQGPLVRETQIVFLNSAPVVHNETEQTSGVAARIRDEEGQWMVDIALPSGMISPHVMDDILGKPMASEGLQIVVHAFWPDFAMVDGEPVSVSEEPNNPAILLQVDGRLEVEELPTLQMAFNTEGGLDYQFLREGVVANMGSVKAGENVSTGWADWVMTVEAAHLSATQIPRVEPVDDDEDGVPGIRAWLRSPDGTDGEPVWIASGRAEQLFFGDDFVRIGFGLRTQRIPFYVRLLEFEVPRDEGTTTPADWISKIEFEDFKTGEKVVRTSRMNHPASYPGGWWHVLSGFNYKFSQASWNPDDLTETTLQVLYDPGWSFKWIGSLLMSVGMGILFYMKPYNRNAGTQQAALGESGSRLPQSKAGLVESGNGLVESKAGLAESGSGPVESKAGVDKAPVDRAGVERETMDLKL